MVQRLPATALGGDGHRDLALDPGPALRFAGELRVAVQHLAQGGLPRRPLVPEVRAHVPPDPQQRLRVHGDGLVAGGPQHPVVVLGVAAGDVLVHRTDGPPERVLPHDGGAHARLGPPGAEQVGEPEDGAVLALGDQLVVDGDRHVGDGGVRAGGFEEGQLVAGLRREPQVVVVAEPDVGGAGGGGAAVAAARQPVAPVVEQNADGAVRIVDRQPPLGLVLVPRHDGLDRPRVVLGDDRGDGLADLHRTRVGGDHHAEVELAHWGLSWVQRVAEPLPARIRRYRFRPGRSVTGGR